MIKVEVKRTESGIKSIQVSGHAHSAKRGEDLVCAAVSSITTGMLNAVDQLFPSQASLVLKQGDEPVIRIEVLEDSDALQYVLNSLMIQLETVAETEGRYIQIKEV